MSCVILPGRSSGSRYKAKKIMKSLLLVLLIYISLASCHPTPLLLETPTVTHLPTHISLTETNTPEPDNTKIPSSHPTSTPPQFLQSFDFPDWVNNLGISILLIAVGDINEPVHRRTFDHLSMVNSRTGEHFDIYVDEISGYFWSPDGSSIGILNQDRTAFLLVDTLSGGISTHSIDENMIYMRAENYFPEALIAYVHDSNNFDFSLISKSMVVSSDGRYVALIGWKNGEIYYKEEDYTYVEDLFTGESIMISEEGDHIVDIDRSWIGESYQIAIAHSDIPTVFGPNCFFPESKTNYWLSIYDGETGKLRQQIDNITSAEFSRDGQKIIYRPNNQSDFPWTDPPCIFNMREGSERCLTEILELRPEEETFSHFEWVPEADIVSYLYFFATNDPYTHHGGFCTFSISSGQSECFLEDFENEYEVPIGYEWSPEGEFVLFISAKGSPCGDDISDLRWGILNTENGEYFFIVEMAGNALGLWRPFTKQE
jgi:hypothetical protein